MNSLVVLFSVMVLAAAQPQWAAIAPAVALAPAAVSQCNPITVGGQQTTLQQQSRIDVKSTPAVVKTDVIAPAIAPAVLAAPIAYSAIAPAAVSSQSQIDIKSAPGIISTIAGAPLTFGVPGLAFGAQIAYGAPIAAAYTPSIYTPAIASAIAPALLKTAKPEADSAPAASSDAAPPQSIPLSDYVPTETPEVAAARAAHLQAKALEESHQIQKRSVGIVAASPVVSTYASPILTRYASSPVIYSSPITRIAPVGLPAPYLTGAYGIHPY